MLSRSASSPALQSLLTLDPCSVRSSSSRHGSLPCIGRAIREFHASPSSNSSSSSSSAADHISLIRRARSENDLRKLSLPSACRANPPLAFGHENDTEFVISDRGTNGFPAPSSLSKHRRQRSLHHESIPNPARSPIGASRLQGADRLQDAIVSREIEAVAMSSHNQSPGHSFGRLHSCNRGDSIQPGMPASPELELLPVMNGQVDVLTEVDDKADCVTSSAHNTFSRWRADDACAGAMLVLDRGNCSQGSEGLDRENCSQGSEGVGLCSAHGDGDSSGRKGGGRRRPHALGGGGRGGADWDSTDMYYQTMIKENPSHPLILRNYAQYLAEYKHDYPKAEEYYQRAILANPRDGEVLGQFAKILWDVRRDKERAASYFERAVQAAPEDSYVMAAHASFLWNLEAEEETHVNPFSSFSASVSPVQA